MIAGDYTNKMQYLLDYLEDATKNYVGEVLDYKTWESFTILSIYSRLRELTAATGKTPEIKARTEDTFLVELADGTIGVLVTLRHQKVRINIIKYE